MSQGTLVATPTSIFTNADCTLDQLVRFLQEVVGVPFEWHPTGGGGVFRAVVLGCLIDVFTDHDFVDDQGIEFSRYKLAIDVLPSGLDRFGEYNQELFKLVPLAIGRAVSKALGGECIVVHNFQRIIAVFS
jgi:hypothetical protein